MWLSQNREAERKREASVQMGHMSLVGPTLGVYLAGERRGVTLVAPGGYHWKPVANDAVLVLSAGEEGTPCLVGREQEATGVALSPGEVWISINDASGIHLRQDGSIHLQGKVFLNGKPLVVPKEEAGGGVG